MTKSVQDIADDLGKSDHHFVNESKWYETQAAECDAHVQVLRDRIEAIERKISVWSDRAEICRAEAKERLQKRTLRQVLRDVVNTV